MQQKFGKILTVLIVVVLAVALLDYYLSKPAILKIKPRELFKAEMQELKETTETPLVIGQVKPFEEKVIAPPPLRARTPAQISILTKAGIFNWTNIQRKNVNLQLLQANALLDQAATAKVTDMFKQQYFAHDNPQGLGAGDLVKNVGYSFIIVGENLALGNFASDETLVRAWMASPGHRANILGTKFQEIGIAIGRGQLEGEETWLAVQTFATPATFCPQPDSALAGSIETGKAQIEKLGAEAKFLKLAIDGLMSRRETIYNQAQQLISEGEELIAAGNEKIIEGNRIYEETGSRAEAQKYWQAGENLQQQGKEKTDRGLAYNNDLKSITAQTKAKIDLYNQTMAKIRAIQTQTKDLIDKYNLQAENYNQCLTVFS